MKKPNAIIKVTAYLLLTFIGTLTTRAEEEGLLHIQSGKIALLFDTLRQSTSDSLSHTLNTRIEQAFEKLLTSNDSSYYSSFENLPNIGKCYSSDGNIRIYTWNYPLSDKTFGYGGYIQFKPLKKNKGKKLKPIALKTAGEAYLPKTGVKIGTNNWYGALYYKAIATKKDGQEYYILLGWSGNDALSDFKTIETLKIAQNKKTATLGSTNAFAGSGRPTNRIVLQYNNNAKVALDYDESKKSIVMDHLSPSDPFYKDIYSFYGPDFTYDAYVYDKKNKGVWRLVENIDQKNKD